MQIVNLIKNTVSRVSNYKCVIHGNLNDSPWWQKKRGRLKIEFHKSKISFFFFIPSIRAKLRSRRRTRE